MTDLLSCLAAWRSYFKRITLIVKLLLRSRHGNAYVTKSHQLMLDEVRGSAAL